MALAVLLALGEVVEQPRFVPSIRLVNPTAYDIDVEVTNAGHDGWMPMWTAKRNTTTVAEQIYDIGDTWVFRFSAQGETADELVVDRASFEQSGWRLAIPEEIGDGLLAKGALPPP